MTDPALDAGLLLLRIVLGVLLMGHGLQKAVGWFDGPGPAAAARLFEGWGFLPGRVMVAVAAGCELVAGVLLVLGLAVELAAAIAVGTMIVAAAPNAVSGLWAARGGIELPLVYALLGAVLALTGPGALSVDAPLALPVRPWFGPTAILVGVLAAAIALLRRRAALRGHTGPTGPASPATKWKLEPSMTESAHPAEPAAPTMRWQELLDYSDTHDLLAKRLYVVFSEPTNGLGPVLDNLDPHVEHQTRLELDGIMFAAGPFASDDEQLWNGEGMFIYRAESLEAAHKIAESDPMHISGARRFRVRPWLLNEGTFSVQLFYSGGKPKIG